MGKSAPPLNGVPKPEMPQSPVCGRGSSERYRLMSGTLAAKERP